MLWLNFFCLFPFIRACLKRYAPDAFSVIQKKGAFQKRISISVEGALEMTLRCLDHRRPRALKKLRSGECRHIPNALGLRFLPRWW